MVSVGIVGAGFSGLCMAIKLQKAGFTDFTIFEAADDIGGTWRANRYPGCACDVSSVMYCYSFEPYPWTQLYSEQKEILQYLHHCADKYKLWDHIRLKTRVTGATYDEDRAVWCVSTAAGQQEEVQVLVLAQGPLSIPTIPDIPGLQGFKGTVMHTAAWDSSVDLAGKKVAVVGTGASAIQAISRLQQVAAELVVFQRTAPWVLPRKEMLPRYATPAAQHGRLRALTVWLQRQADFWRAELFLGTALVGNKQGLLRQIEGLALRHMKAAVKDPDMRRQLTPHFSVGCKRILASDEYYPALAADNVKLVASGLKQFESDGSTLVSDKGDVIPDVDVVIFATGFDVTASTFQFDIQARGRDLAVAIRARPGAYYGLAVAGFPNMFTLLGLNTGLGHQSVVFMAECQINLIVQLLRGQLQAKGHHWVEVTQQAQHAFNQELQRRLKTTVWLSGCKSWYLTTPGKAQGSSSSGGNNGGSSGGSSGTQQGPEGSGSLASSQAGGQAVDDNSSGGSDSSGGGIVMWPGLVSEFWWRTLWPAAKDWASGKAAHPAGGAGADAVQQGKVLRKETLLQHLLASVGAWTEEKKGV